MGPGSLESSGLRRCPRCGAGARAAAPWCTQCHLDLLGDPDLRGHLGLRGHLDLQREPDLPSLPAKPVPERDAPRPERGPGPVRADPRWPCPDCGTSTPLESSVCDGCGAGFLAALRESAAPLAAVPVVTALVGRSGLQRVLLTVGLVLLLVALLSAGGLLLPD